MTSLLCFTLAALMIRTVFSWHPTGHFLVATIAQKEISKVDPTLVPYMESLLAVLSPFTKEKKYPFVEEAEWADDIKYLNWKSFNNWHFYDNFYQKNDTTFEETSRARQKRRANTKTEKPDETNIVWAINECKMTLKTNRTSQVDSHLGKSFMLRYLVHLMGDIHQPLHNISLQSKAFPSGDRGGNLFAINVPGARNLHLFWDLCLRQFKEMRAPLAADDWQYLSTVSDSLTTEFPRSAFAERLKITSTKAWCTEAKLLAQNVVYTGIEVGGKPSAEYVQTGFTLVKQQLALGGYRLADVLLEVFAHHPTAGEFEQQESERLQNFRKSQRERNGEEALAAFI